MMRGKGKGEEEEEKEKEEEETEKAYRINSISPDSGRTTSAMASIESIK